MTISAIALMPSSITAYNAPGRTEIVEVIDMSIPTRIKHYATLYNVSEATMTRIVECESNFIEDAQSIHTYKRDRPELGVKKGEREKSYGLVQVHLPSHPNITYEQAIDPDFSLNFLALNLSEGRGYLWTCFKE